MELKYQSMPTQADKKVATIQVRLVMEDTTGTVWITDLMLQGGVLATIWTGHPSEIVWSFDG